MHPLIHTFLINQKMNEFLLGAIPDAHLSDVAASKGRSVGQQFAHIHNVRLMWLKAAAPQLLEGLLKIEKEDSMTGSQLTTQLQSSATAIASLLELGIAEGRIKNFKPHPEAFVGYLIAHEAHHRSQVIIVLKEHKHLPDKKILFGLWEWGNK